MKIDENVTVYEAKSGLQIVIKDNNEDIEIDVSKFWNKNIIQDLKILIYYDLNKLNVNEKFNINNVLRDEIIIINEDFSNYLSKNINLKVTIDTYNKKGEIDGKTTLFLGYFKVIGKDKLQPLSLNNDMFKKIEKHSIKNYTSEIWNSCKGKERFRNYSKGYFIDDYSSTLKKYFCNGLFKLYYYMTLESAKINNNVRISGKASAMCSYLAVRRVLNEYFITKKLQYEVSNPNVFIKNNNTEFDALIIKKYDNKDNNDRFIFSEDEVEAIIEIKTSGYFSKKEDLAKDSFIEYIKSEKINNKKIIYISIYESYGARDTSVHYYEYILCNILTIKDAYGIFGATKKDQQYLLIPYEYDLKKILDNIFK